MKEDQEELSEQEKKRLEREDYIKNQRARLVSQNREYHSAMKEKQLQSMHDSIGGLHREVTVFMVLVAASTAFLVYTILAVEDDEMTQQLMAWAFKSYIAYPVYLVFKVIRGVIKKTRKKK